MAPNWYYGNTTEPAYRLQVFANTIRYNQTSCPLKTPYVNIWAGVCFNCPPNATFNLGTNLCDCPIGTTYNITLNTCSGPCTQGQYYNATGSICCPIGFVYDPSSSTNCSCPPGQYYNTTGSVCCLNGYLFDPSLSQCTAPKTPIPPTVPTNISNNTISACHPSAPYWNPVTYSCQACPTATPIFNTTTQMCQACPNGTQWDTSTAQCIVPVTPVTPPKVCKGSTPYLNPVTNQC